MTKRKGFRITAEVAMSVIVLRTHTDYVFARPTVDLAV